MKLAREQNLVTKNANISFSFVLWLIKSLSSCDLWKEKARMRFEIIVTKKC